MRNLWVICLGAFMLLGSALAQESDTPSFEIDPVATAQAPWKEGEVIADAVTCPGGGRDCYRIFLGVTREGHKVLQEFYLENKVKATDPFLIKPVVSWESIDHMDEVENPLDILDSNLTAWYSGGAKNFEWVKNGPEDYQVIGWYENGQKQMQASFVNGSAANLIRWDEEGKLIEN